LVKDLQRALPGGWTPKEFAVAWEALALAFKEAKLSAQS
jgi:hypothetical protein